MEYLAERASNDAAFREQRQSDPKKAIGDTLRVKFDDNMKIAVHADTPNELNMVLPISLAADDLSDADLESVAGGSIDPSRERIFQIPPRHCLPILK